MQAMYKSSGFICNLSTLTSFALVQQLFGSALDGYISAEYHMIVMNIVEVLLIYQKQIEMDW